MKNNSLIKSLNLWGAVFVVVSGSLLHFVYAWSGNNFLVGLFAPVSESPWEHMKLAFTPLIIFAFVDYYFLRTLVKNYCFSLIKQIGISIAFMLLIFYGQEWILGKSILIIDIASFILSIVIAKYFAYKIQIGAFKDWEFKGIKTVSAIMIIIVTAFFFYATINPPRIALFLDENTGTYGIEK